MWKSNEDGEIYQRYSHYGDWVKMRSLLFRFKGIFLDKNSQNLKSVTFFLWELKMTLFNPRVK